MAPQPAQEARDGSQLSRGRATTSAPSKLHARPERASRSRGAGMVEGMGVQEGYPCWPEKDKLLRHASRRVTVAFLWPT